MKIAYLFSNRPEFLEKLLAFSGPDPLVVASDADGFYRAEDLARLADVDALMVGNEPITEQVLAAAPKVRIVQRFGVGYEKLDLEAAAKRGIPCCNLAGVNKEAVAEHCILLMLTLARNLLTSNALTREGQWGEARFSMLHSFELAGKKLGIIGLGNTGLHLARRAIGFEMDILYNDIREIPAGEVASVQGRRMEKEALLREADIVSINVNFNPTAANLMDARALSLMKPGALLVCCSRGGIIDEDALRDALNEGRLGGAGLDVYGQEPLTRDNPLLQAKNVVMTPHMAGVTQEAGLRNIRWAFENVRRVLEQGESPRWVLNGV